MSLPIILTNYKINVPSNAGVVPRIGHLHCPNNTLSDVTTAGALNPLVTAEGISLLPTDIIMVVASNSSQIYYPKIAAGTGIITLTALGS